MNQRFTGEKRAEDKNTNKYLENEKGFLDEIKNIFHIF